MRKICLILILGLFLFINPKQLFAASGGIHIGDKFNEFDQAKQTVGQQGWITVMMTPQHARENLDRFIKSHPNIVVRGHYPGVTLTSQYANEWAETLSQIDGLVNYNRTVYFMPVNEPNFIDEGPIPAQTVVDYVNSLSQALSSKNLLHTKVKLLSPGLNLYTLSDEGPSYVDSLGANFFSQFDGITLHLYGEFNGSEINQGAPAIKRGVYKDFLTSHLRIPANTANTVKIFALETGVKKIGEPVKYRENTSEIEKYFKLIKPEWDKDPNFIMFSIFSYDPADYNSPSWIYQSDDVVSAMGLTPSTSVSPPPDDTIPQDTSFTSEYDITKHANERLLPKSLLDIKKESEKACNGIQVGPVCLPFGKIVDFLAGSNKPLIQETEAFQPLFVNKEKRESINKGCGSIINLPCNIKNLIGLAPRQVEEKPSGSLNTFRPKKLEFSDVSSKNTLGVATNSSVLAAQDSPEIRVKDSYKFTLKMLLPHSVNNPLEEEPATSPVVSPPPAQIPVCSGNICNDCILNNRKDILPYYRDTGGWDISCSNQNAIVEDWCRISSADCSGVKIAQCLTQCSTPVPSVTVTVTPPPPPSDDLALKDNIGPQALKSLITQVGDHFNVPPAVIAPVSWIEGSNVWRYSDSQIIEYSREGARDPFWAIPFVNTCRYNPWTAAGPMQFTAGQWSIYKYSVRQSPGESARNPIVCNIKDPFWAAGKKLKVDSLTGNSTSIVWNKQAVANAGWRYYGACGACDANGDPELSKGKRDSFACNRLRMTYCEYMWKYYQCNTNSSNSSEFAACTSAQGLNIIRF